MRGDAGHTPARSIVLGRSVRTGNEGWGMAEQAKATLQRGVPWRRGLAWWIVGLEGVLLLAAGIFVVASPDNAKDAVRVIIGAFILANSISTVLAGMRASALS